MAIILIGYMGSGKSSVGKQLAQSLNLAYVDLDLMISQKAGKTIQEIFAQDGEDYFRKIESECLADVCEQNSVVATGGGIILKAENRQLLSKQKFVIFLTCEDNELIHRLKADQKNIRPIIQDKTSTEILAIYQQRLPFYQVSATMPIDTTNKSIATIVDEIKEKMEKDT